MKLKDDTKTVGGLTSDAAFSCYHLAEAASAITSLLTSIAVGGDLDRKNSSVASEAAHMYEHLNWFWHGQSRADRSKLDLSADEFEKFSDFPLELYEHMASKLSKK